MSRQVFVLAVVAIVVGSAADGLAQTCACSRVEAPCSAYWRADAVFVGRADAIAGAADARVVTFRVVERLQGVASSAMDVALGSARQRCGGAYRVGREYLVYAVRNASGGFTVAPCDRVRPVEDAAADLSYARAVKEGSAPPGKIGGQVLLARRDLGGRRIGTLVPLKDVPVRVERYAAPDAGANPQDTVITNEAGDFSVVARGAGRYGVTLDLQARYFLETNLLALELRDPRACGAIDAIVHENGRVAGRIVDASGRPVPGLTVDLATPSLAQRMRAITDRHGQYEFSRVPSGRFVIGVDLMGLSASASSMARHPRIFFPGIDKVGSASRVTVARGDRVSLADFRLPAYASLVAVTGVVLDADGTPAEGARIYLKDVSENGRILAEPAVADFVGRFVVSVIAGGEYELFAERARGARVDSSPPARIRAVAVPATLKLVLQRRY